MLSNLILRDGIKVYYQACAGEKYGEVELNFYSTPVPVPRYHLMKLVVGYDEIEETLKSVKEECSRITIVDERVWSVVTLKDFICNDKVLNFHVYDTMSEFEYSYEKMDLYAADLWGNSDILGLECYVNNEQEVMIVNVEKGAKDDIAILNQKDKLRKFFYDKNFKKNQFEIPTIDNSALRHK